MMPAFYYDPSPRGLAGRVAVRLAIPRAINVLQDDRLSFLIFQDF